MSTPVQPRAKVSVVALVISPRSRRRQMFELFESMRRDEYRRNTGAVAPEVLGVKEPPEPPVVTLRVTVAPAQLTTCASKSTVRVHVVDEPDWLKRKVVAPVSWEVKKCSPSLSLPL